MDSITQNNILGNTVSNDTLHNSSVYIFLITLFVTFFTYVLIILVGTKSDLRQDAETQSKLSNQDRKMVSKEVAENLAREIGAIKYLECSALTQEGLKNVFDDAKTG